MRGNFLKKAGLRLVKLVAWLLVISLLGLMIYLLVILPRQEIAGAHDPTPFEFDKTLDLVKTLPDGGTFTVNNSPATFRLDVAKPNQHSRRLFPDYAAALRYCQEAGLATIPSVQLVQGKLKHFDDSLCASLEMAVQDGLPGVGKREALEQLLKLLQRQAGTAAEEATVYVATALTLAGVEVDLSPDLKLHVQRARQRFLADPVVSRPVGFWDADERHRALFQSDRFLMQGLSIAESPVTCVLLAKSIAKDEKLAEAFQRFREFGDKLTNPSTGVPFEVLAGLDAAEASRRFGKGEKFALVAYADSKESAFLARLLADGKFTDNKSTMALIVEAVRGGQFCLEPAPTSGWYDYQWHALETLLAPERGRESGKLRLSAAYRKRLENAFATSLTKERELHIKRLPVVTLGMELRDKEPPKVEISPEFSAEPTLTVYLRFGRSYRFLRQSLRAVLGESALQQIHRPSAAASVDKELQNMAQFCYGLYETLSREIGQQPQYLQDEITSSERAEAIATFSRWQERWRDDLTLRADTRVAVPIARWPGGPIRYWATGGVKLEPVIYRFEYKPVVRGFVEPVLVPGRYYLPTDVFIEFKRASDVPLARAEFREICNQYRDEPALRKALGADLPQRWFMVTKHVPLGLGLVATFGIMIVLWRKRRAWRWFVAGAIVLMGGWICGVVFSPRYRTKVIVRYVARINTPLGMMSEMYLMSRVPPEPSLAALADLLNDSNPDVRYLAARFIANATNFSETSNAWRQVGIRAALIQAADDVDPETAAFALQGLGQYRDPATADVLSAALKAHKLNDLICENALWALGSVGDPRTVELVDGFCDDPRRGVRRAAVLALARIPSDAAWERTTSLLESPDALVRKCVLVGLKWAIERKYPQKAWEEREAEFRSILLDKLRSQTLPFAVRYDLAKSLHRTQDVAQAGALLLSGATTPEQTNQVLTWVLPASLQQEAYWLKNNPLPTILSNVTVQNMFAKVISEQDVLTVRQATVRILVDCLSDPNSIVRKRAADALGSLGKAAANALPALKAAREDTNQNVRTAATSAVERIQSAAEHGFR